MSRMIEISDVGYITVVTETSRECIAPGDIGRAEELLGDDAAFWITQWTTEQIAAYQAEIGPPPFTLEEAKVHACDLVDHQAELCRLKFLTDGVGQAMEYMYCGMEVSQTEQVVDPQPEDFPLLAAEYASLLENNISVTFAEVVAKTRQEVAAWIAVGSLIKQLRRTAKLRIRQATTIEEMDAVFPISWPEPPEEIPIGTGA